MKSASSSIVFAPSKTTSQRLDQLSSISQLSIQEILDNVLGDYLDDIFGDAPDADLLSTLYINGRTHSSQTKAKAIASAYNAYSIECARKVDRRWANRATVIKDTERIFRVEVR